MDAKHLKSLQDGRKNADYFNNKLDKWEKSEKSSRSLAIHAFCTGCVGCTADNNESGYQEYIRGCTAPDCPLYNFRPYK